MCIVLRAILAVCLLSSLAACSEEPSDPADRGTGSPAPPKSSTTTIESEASAPRGTEASVGGRVVEHTMGGETWRRDERVVRIERAELPSDGAEEIFVRATIRGQSETEDCFLMRGRTWVALRDAIESKNISEAPEVLETFWSDPVRTETFSSGDTYVVLFRKDPDQRAGTSDPRETPFFTMCYKKIGVADDDPRETTWYDVAHVDGTPRAP